MAAVLNFGKYKGKTLEWVFFHDPGYIWWIRENNIHNDHHKFPQLVRTRFDDLVRRGLYLRIPGLCSWCNKRPITRMFLTLHISGGLGRVDFDCDECEPGGSSVSVPLTPSFFTPDYYRNYDKTGARFLIDAIKWAYYRNSSERMTQQKMEDFFNNPNNFVNF
jgi:hypothetical protein